MVGSGSGHGDPAHVHRAVFIFFFFFFFYSFFQHKNLTRRNTAQQAHTAHSASTEQVSLKPTCCPAGPSFHLFYLRDQQRPSDQKIRNLRHVSAVICRENSRMLGLTLDARCRARAIQRSAPQRSPVADSDTDP